MKNSLFFNLLLALFLLLTPIVTLALDIDRDKPVHINADKVSIDEKTGISIYLGNVNIRQGSMSLIGEKVTVFQPNGKLEKIIVTGEPAQFTQLSDKNNQKIIASALKLNYFTVDEKLILTGQASLSQGQNSFTGHKIEYNTRNSTVTANTDGNKKQRVNAVIVPKTLDN